MMSKEGGNDACIMKIEILGAESLGVRGLCCFVKTKSKRILIDPGIALGFFRYRLPPHPVQIAAGERIRKKIVKAWSEATDIVFSHFHGDHVPLKNANPYQLNIDKVKGLNSAVRIWAKLSPLSPIEKTRVESISDSLGKELIPAEGKEKGVLSFFGPVPHGEGKNNLEKVIITRVKEDSVFVHASDLQLLNDEAVSQVLSLKPDILLVSGPPLYLSKMSNELIEIAWRNAIRLSKNVKTLILDYHLMRDNNGVLWLEKLSTKTKNAVICGADFMEKPRLLLEARRRDLYRNIPVPEGWHEAYGRGEVDAGQYWDMAKNFLS